MTPQEAISRLRGAGLSEAEIATAVKSSQPTINRIWRGTSSPRYDLGRSLVELAKRKRAPEARDAA